jgi:DNA-binding PadR family transcriptional regulator
LAVLAGFGRARGENAHGVPISEELEKRTGRDVAIGSVYAALERLEDKGFVTQKSTSSNQARRIS